MSVAISRASLLSSVVTGRGVIQVGEVTFRSCQDF